MTTGANHRRPASSISRVSPSPSRIPRLILLAYIATLATGIGVIFSLLAEIQDRYGFPTWSLGLLAGIPFAMTLFGNLWLTPLPTAGGRYGWSHWAAGCWSRPCSG